MTETTEQPVDETTQDQPAASAQADGAGDVAKNDDQAKADAAE